MDSANSARLERGRGSAEGRCRESRAWGRHRARSSVAPATQDLLGAQCAFVPRIKITKNNKFEKQNHRREHFPPGTVWKSRADEPDDEQGDWPKSFPRPRLAPGKSKRGRFGKSQPRYANNDFVAYSF